VLGDYDGESANPQVTVFKGDVYVSWVAGAEKEFTGELMLARSSNRTQFEAAVISENATNAAVASSDSTLYLAWRHHQRRGHEHVCSKH
jgi:hypothetical protein